MQGSVGPLVRAWHTVQGTTAERICSGIYLLQRMCMLCPLRCSLKGGREASGITSEGAFSLVAQCGAGAAARTFEDISPAPLITSAAPKSTFAFEPQRTSLAKSLSQPSPQAAMAKGLRSKSKRRFRTLKRCAPGAEETRNPLRANMHGSQVCCSSLLPPGLACIICTKPAMSPIRAPPFAAAPTAPAAAATAGCSDLHLSSAQPWRL